MSRIGLAVMISAVVPAALGSPALANGRRPTPVHVYFDPADPDHVIAGVTFGFLVSRDGGSSFRWVCEQAACPSPQPGGLNGCDTFDPDVEVSADGDLFLTTIFGVFVSRDGCVYDPVGGPLLDRFVPDIELAADGVLWAATGDGAIANQVWASADGGRSFAARNRALEPGWWVALQSAPSKPDRLYLSGFVPGEPNGDGGFRPSRSLLFRTDDGGDSWTPLAVTAFPSGVDLEIPLVSPVDPDVVFVRARGLDADTLYRSSDAGESFAAVLSLDNTSLNISDPIASLSLTSRTDGQTMYAGSPLGGLRVSTDAGKTWSPAGVQPMTWCLGVAPGGELYACSENWDPDMRLDPTVRFALGRSANGGASWDKVLRFADIAGPLDCPEGTPQHEVCEVTRWCGQAEAFGIEDPACERAGDAAPPSDAGPPAPPDDGCNGCGGCSVGLAGVLFVAPGRRRRRHRGAR